MADNRYTREIYEGYREHWRLSSTLVGDYGKWLIAQLTLINVGAIFLLSNEQFRPALAHGSFWWFVAGIMLSLFCGLAAWFNWGLNRDLAKVYFDPAILEDDAAWPEPSRALLFMTTLTYWLSLALGLASVFCIPLGAWSAWSATHP
jgi:hypothetical protein